VRQARLVHDLAHEVADGRWLAVGSGGYDWRRVVPRSWAILWSEMSERPLPDRLPAEWLDRWDTDPGEPMPATFLDNPADLRHIPRRHEIERLNEDAVNQTRRLFDL